MLPWGVLWAAARDAAADEGEGKTGRLNRAWGHGSLAVRRAGETALQDQSRQAAPFLGLGLIA